jgi:hypothetical protein
MSVADLDAAMPVGGRLRIPVQQLPSTWDALALNWREPYLPVLRPIADQMYWLTRIAKTKDEQDRQRLNEHAYVNFTFSWRLIVAHRFRPSDAVRTRCDL